jgi:hypothetical protein
VRKSLEDIVIGSTLVATDGALPSQALTPGREVVRLAQLAAALHMSQAAPLLAGQGAPKVWFGTGEDDS